MISPVKTSTFWKPNSAQIRFCTCWIIWSICADAVSKLWFSQWFCFVWCLVIACTTGAGCIDRSMLMFQPTIAMKRGFLLIRDSHVSNVKCLASSTFVQLRSCSSSIASLTTYPCSVLILVIGPNTVFLWLYSKNFVYHSFKVCHKAVYRWLYALNAVYFLVQDFPSNKECKKKRDGILSFRLIVSYIRTPNKWNPKLGLDEKLHSYSHWFFVMSRTTNTLSWIKVVRPRIPTFTIVAYILFNWSLIHKLSLQVLLFGQLDHISDLDSRL